MGKRKFLARWAGMAAAAVLCWFAACVQEERHPAEDWEDGLLATRTLAETGMPDGFFSYSDTVRFGTLVPALQRRDSVAPYAENFQREYGLPLWNCSWLEKGMDVSCCFVPVLANDGARHITTLWLFGETAEGIAYKPLRLEDNPDDGDWRFIFDFMTYRVFGADNDWGVLVRPSRPLTRGMTYIWELYCDHYAVFLRGEMVRSVYENCFDRIIWVDEAWDNDNFSELEDHIEGDAVGRIPGGGSSGSEKEGDVSLGGLGDNPPDPEQVVLDPCGWAKALNLDPALTKKLDELFKEVSNYHAGDVENGWIKTTEGEYLSPSERTSSSLKYDNADLQGKRITEWFHSHPGGSCRPSWADLVALATYYNKGRIAASMFSYGIVTDMGCIAITINSEEKFKAFVKEVLKGNGTDLYKSFQSLEKKTGGKIAVIAKFIDFLNQESAGLSVYFNDVLYGADSSELTRWIPQSSFGDAKLVPMGCID